MEGLKLWESTIVLVRFPLLNSSRYCGKRILDVGAGVGVVGISAAAFLRADVVMLDYQEAVLGLCQKNIEATRQSFGQNCLPEVRFLDWNPITGCKFV
jgi:predicted nicotinamide N-methyase